jgi:maleate cis-trans isomerase
VFGYRARIGYTVPLSAVEIFPYEFYRMAPEGVSLMVSTCQSARDDSREETYLESEAVARQMAEAGVSVVVLGGASPGHAFGADRMRRFLKEIEDEYGIPTTSALEAQLHALREMGAHRLAVVTPFSADGRGEWDRLTGEGFEVVGVGGAGYTYADFGRCPTDAPAVVARKLAAEHPEADTIFFPAAHWPAASNIETLEQELGRTVVSSAQAILWEALRRCQITDPIQGYGRLLREH